jgi:hypothetical protein
MVIFGEEDIERLTQVSGITELLNLLGVKSAGISVGLSLRTGNLDKPLTVRYGESVVVGHLSLINPVGDLILMEVLDVTTKAIVLVAVDGWPTALLATLVHVCLSRSRGWQPLQDQEAGKAKGSLKAPLEDSRINAAALEVRPVDLEVAVAVFGQTILVRWASSSQVDVVDLSDEATQSAWSDVDLAAVVGSAGGINVETGQNLTNGLINTQNNLLHGSKHQEQIWQRSTECHWDYIPEHGGLDTGKQW